MLTSPLIQSHVILDFVNSVFINSILLRKGANTITLWLASVIISFSAVILLDTSNSKTSLVSEYIEPALTCSSLVSMAAALTTVISSPDASINISFLSFL